jgi:hypothetical protein
MAVKDFIIICCAAMQQLGKQGYAAVAEGNELAAAARGGSLGLHRF